MQSNEYLSLKRQDLMNFINPIPGGVFYVRWPGEVVQNIIK